jgi:hypothetical protein
LQHPIILAIEGAPGRRVASRQRALQRIIGKTTALSENNVPAKARFVRCGDAATSGKLMIAHRKGGPSVKRILGALGALCLSTAAASGGVVVGPVVNPANGHSYSLLTQGTWTAGEAEAVTLGGHLATVNDAAEQEWIFSNFGAFGGVQRLLWIGYNDAAAEGTFTWVSGETPAYTNWTPGEPNALTPLEDYAAIYYPNHSAGGRWNDWDDRAADPINLPFHSVVEVVPEPGTMGVAIVGVGLLLQWRRRRAT